MMPTWASEWKTTSLWMSIDGAAQSFVLAGCYGLVFGIAVWLTLRFLLRKKPAKAVANAATRYAIWCLAMGCIAAAPFVPAHLTQQSQFALNAIWASAKHEKDNPQDNPAWSPGKVHVIGESAGQSPALALPLQTGKEVRPSTAGPFA